MAAAGAPSGLFARALLAFLVLPGTIGFLIPLWVFRPDDGWATFNFLGLIALLPGLIVLLVCVRDFYRTGKGTLAPWSSPTRVVDVGLYRVTRNPMYIGVLLILCGWAWGFGARSLWIYAAVVMLLFHVRVVVGEEPWLARTHGDEWARYRARVPRWLPFGPLR
jgi:protein-S-isoprenylcysteine O-methyltransferase Ste14